MRIVKEKINEAYPVYNKAGEVQDMTIRNYFHKTIEFIREKVYAELNDDQVYELNKQLKTWFDDNVFE